MNENQESSDRAETASHPSDEPSTPPLAPREFTPLPEWPSSHDAVDPVDPAPGASAEPNEGDGYAAAVSPTGDSPRWIYVAAGVAFALALLMVLLVLRQDEPGPSNEHAREACDAMARVSTDIIDGRLSSFEGQLDDVQRAANAAADDDARYEALAAAVRRLNEDPQLTSEMGSDAVDVIAEQCR